MIRCGKYKHFKGNIYQVTDIAKHTETGEDMVIYYDCKDTSKLWGRPLSMFIEEIDLSDYKGPRFTYIKENI